MKKKKITKSMTAMLLLFVIAGACIGTSLAFITDKADVVQNTMIPGEVTTAVKETFDGITKSDVQIKNTGNTDAYIRAAVVVTWQKVDSEGNVFVYGEKPKETDYILTMPDESNWILGSDGFYYHKAPVKSEDQYAENCYTSVLIEKCELKSGVTPPADYKLCVEIIASGIQAKGFADNGEAVVVKEWGVTLDSDGNIESK